MGMECLPADVVSRISERLTLEDLGHVRRVSQGWRHSFSETVYALRPSAAGPIGGLAVFPCLEVVDLGRCSSVEIDDAYVATMAALPCLRRLALTHCKLVTGSGLQALARLRSTRASYSIWVLCFGRHKYPHT